DSPTRFSVARSSPPLRWALTGSPRHERTTMFALRMRSVNENAAHVSIDRVDQNRTELFNGFEKHDGSAAMTSSAHATRASEGARSGKNATLAQRSKRCAIASAAR